jgi:hypothetical protein
VAEFGAMRCSKTEGLGAQGGSRILPYTTLNTFAAIHR